MNIEWGEHPIVPARFHGYGYAMKTENHEPDTKMITLLKRLSLVLLVTMFFVIGTGCNTAHGFGKDVSNTGDAIQKKTR